MWFIIALVVAVGLTMLVFWLRSRDISLTWYEWLIGVVGLILLFFTLQNFFGSLDEGESTAATTFLLMTGLPALIMLVIAFMLPFRRSRAAS